MKNKNLGLYIHIPFRNNDFNYLQTHSYYGMNLYAEKYFEMLNKELEIRNPFEYNIDSIYIGGGDPSCITSNFVTDLIKNVKEKYKVDKNCEITIEITSDCLFPKINDYISVGINRFSIKVFPFNDESWNYLIKKVSDKVEYINSKCINNINLDIYFAYQNQEISLDFLERLKVPHLSFYSLNECEYDDLESKILYKISNFMKKTNYIHYEINHYAEEGYKSKHNCKYWNLDQYMGIGLGANGFIDGLLYKNELEFDKYFDKILFGKIPYYEKEFIQGEELEKVYIISKMGTNEGININSYKERFNVDFELKYGEIMEKFILENLIEKHIDNYRFTDNGMYLSNKFYIEIL